MNTEMFSDSDRIKILEERADQLEKWSKDLASMLEKVAGRVNKLIHDMENDKWQLD